jgi:sugar phosphate isomerase/epimerase
MKIGCNTVSFRKYPLEKALETVAEAGYEYVEIEGNLAWCSHVDPYKDDPIKFMNLVKQYGFKGVSAIGVHREMISDPNAVADVKQALTWAKAAGVPVVITDEGSIPDGMSEKEGLDIIKSRLEEMVERAEAEKTYLALETHGYFSLTPGGMENLLSLAPSKWLKINYDMANVHRGDYIGTNREGYAWKLNSSKKGDEVATLKSIVNYVAHVHAKDVIGRKAVTLGKGEVNVKECVRILKQNGYEGVLSFESEGEDSFEGNKKMIKESLGCLKKLITEL